MHSYEKNMSLCTLTAICYCARICQVEDASTYHSADHVNTTVTELSKTNIRHQPSTSAIFRPLEAVPHALDPYS